MIIVRELACKPGNLVRMGIRFRNTNDANTPAVPSVKHCKLKSAIAQYLPKHPTFFPSPLCCRKAGESRSRRNAGKNKKPFVN